MKVENARKKSSNQTQDFAKIDDFRWYYVSFIALIRDIHIVQRTTLQSNSMCSGPFGEEFEAKRCIDHSFGSLGEERVAP